MNNEIRKQRIIDEAKYIIENKSTNREAAINFGVSKSTICYDMNQLKNMDMELYNRVREIAELNLKERANRGGFASRDKFIEWNKNNISKPVGPKTIYKRKRIEQIKVLYAIIPNGCLSEITGLEITTLEGIANKYGLKKTYKKRYIPLETSKVKKKEITNSLVQRLVDSGYTVKEICELLDIARNTYYRRREGNKHFD